MTGLYIHIPFCLSKCPYCDFYSVKYGKSAAEEYKNAVIRNLKFYSENYNRQFDTVYFGGGTPILLWKEICEIISFISLTQNSEITLEANPCVVLKENLTQLKKAGVNRISIGIQSLNDNELKALGRRHNSQTALKAIDTAYNCGFDNISADIMLGTPLQDSQSLDFTVNELCSMPVSHISAYMLKIEENTPYAKEKLILPDEDSVCDMYLNSVQNLENHGILQYEISNFAKKGYECKHNLIYWNCDEYLGIGPAAHSFFNGERFYVSPNLEDFIKAEKQEVNKESESFLKWGGYEEYLMLRLRLKEGLDLSKYEQRGGNVQLLLSQTKKIPSQYIKCEGSTLSLTPQGFLVSNSVIGTLLDFD